MFGEYIKENEDWREVGYRHKAELCQKRHTKSQSVRTDTRSHA